MSRKKDRRIDARFPLVLTVDFHGAPDVVHDYTENLSAGGLFIRTERSFSPGERVSLVLSFPGLLVPQELEVEVLRGRAAGPKGPAGVAVVVPEDAHDSRQRLETLTQAVRGAGPVPYRLLLVEDNSLVAAMYTSALKRLSGQEGLGGIAVEIATDGEKAADRLRRLPRIDMVVTDVYLPMMSGLALLEEMRSEPGLASIPVIVISAGSGEERSHAARLGAKLFLQKPVKCQDIVGTIRALLAAKAQGGGAAK
ncbi:MAG: hypothetical protein A2V77_00295 [Anaeromyxobacter sp. RBG_16_69_14]|nr:MAG: hypothetical protein A2V77_00295 [Anaeromyxobacter sp. RBG_16_69_14]